MNGLQKVERDTMPRQVALELLCRSNRMTNRERKTYMRALETHYTSTLPPREDRKVDILAKRLKNRPLLHLLKRDKRCRNTRALMQQAYVTGTKHLKRLEEREGKPDQKEMLQILFLQRQIAALLVKAAEIDMAWDCLTDEINRRKKICQQPKNATS